MEQSKMDKAVCRCKKVFFEDLENAVANGASTFEEVQEVTKVAKGCGRCKKHAEEVVQYIMNQTR